MSAWTSAGEPDIEVFETPDEVSQGTAALIADALELGLDATVRDYLRCIHKAWAAPEAPTVPAPRGGASDLGRPGAGHA